MDAGRLSICGEESFGTGSDHIREKDGLWAVVAWLNILAAANKETSGIGINEILQRHYHIYGRSFFSRYDYEEVDSAGAQALVDALNEHISNQSLLNTRHASSTGEFVVSATSNFMYTDPIDGSVSKNQGQIVQFSDGSRVVFRLSGTGSQGATVRLYVERYTKDETQFTKPTAEGLKGLIEVAIKISRLEEFTKRSEPTVITVRVRSRVKLFRANKCPRSDLKRLIRGIFVSNNRKYAIYGQFLSHLFRNMRHRKI